MEGPVMTAHALGMSAWYSAADCRLADFAELVATPTVLAEYPHASAVEQGVLVYDCGELRSHVGDPDGRRMVMSELARALSDGPGVVVLAGAYADPAVVDEATEAFRAIIAAEKADGTAHGDHFAQAGANDRVWNALEKLAVADPGAFARYYSNDMIALVCEAWLGVNYQVTSQVNQVNPGGKAQSPHRDFHLGFQSEQTATTYPKLAHHLSQVLTLQGAVAHCDMPLESGPTYLLPHSQKYGPGYVAWHLPEFKEYFEQHFVQLPLRKGDAIFFSPALVHAAGENHSSAIQRMANLLQVSSAFGRAMETIDRERIVNAVYPELLRLQRAGMTADALHNAIAASAEGYAFPTNLDRDEPRGSDAPASQADIVRLALRDEWPPSQLADALAAHALAHLSH